MKTYRISSYGRIGYAIYFLMCIPFSFFIFLPFSSFSHDHEQGLKILTFLIGIGSWYLMIYSCSQLCRKSPRFILNDNGFRYNGLFLHKYFQWEDVEKLSLKYGRLHYLSVHLKSGSKWWWLKKGLDVSGLSPNCDNLIMEMNTHLLRVLNSKDLSRL